VIGDVEGCGAHRRGSFGSAQYAFSDLKSANGVLKRM
jgi:hypothetical protein